MTIRPSFSTLLSSIVILAAFTALCALGIWQVKRLAWKEGIISKLDAAYAHTADSAPLDLTSIQPGDYSYGWVEGIFMPDKALLLGPRTREGRIGNDLIVPLKIKDRTLLINMGWTDAALEDLPITHVQDKKIRFAGLAFTPSWNRFTPDNDPAQDLWFKPDIQEIAQVRGLANSFPFILYAQEASYKFDATFPNNTKYYPNNNHLQYAIFWFTMAFLLLIMTGIVITSRKRGRSSPPLKA
ncbi:MAG: SURF1 family protein [Alphaproteobacteria bacterium]|nr:SURF1 family protein [Alphaproteobacteria bacterium]